MENVNHICASAYDLDRHEYIRLLKKEEDKLPQHFTPDEIRKFQAIPFNRMECIYSKPSSLEPPHIEDRIVHFLQYEKTCDEASRKRGLQFISHSTLQEIFGAVPDGNQDHRLFLADTPPLRSLGTLALSALPKLHCVMSKYHDEKRVYKLTLKDGDAFESKWVPIVDLRFLNYVEWKQGEKRETTDTIIHEFHDRFQKADFIFIRLGLTRIFPTYPRSDYPARGFWLQATGIYPFPDYLDTFDFWSYSPHYS